MNLWTARRSEHASHTLGAFNTRHDDEAQYQRDRARIIHSAAFRALQSKTQVLGLGESDYYRTRLTHSLEVAQIGSGLTQQLLTQHPSADWQKHLPCSGLIEAICLAHDLGHPPFGHGGEVALHYLMHAQGGFEGNGQTLRIATRLGEFSEHCGLDLSRRTLLGTIKYPVLYSQVRTPPPSHDTAPLNLSAWHPPKCLYDSESDILAWILAPFEPHDVQRFTRIEQGRSCCKSFDASIMEIADDIAYAVHDLEDAVAMGLLDRSAWQQWRHRHREGPNGRLSDEALESALFDPAPHRRKYAISKLVSDFIKSVHIVEDPGFAHPLLRFNAAPSAEAAYWLSALKALVFDEVITCPEVLALRHRGQQSLIALFDNLAANPSTLLPRSVWAQWEHSETPLRVLSDYLAGLTDLSATRLHRRLIGPGSSIFTPI